MEYWALLLLLGFFTYFILKRGVARLTTVPWWALWGVMMFPPAVLVLSVEVFARQPHPLVVLLLFLVSYIVTVVLLRRGQLRRPLPKTGPAAANSLSTPEETEGAIPWAGVASQDESPARPALTDIPRETLRECFPWTVFYLQDVEYRPQAIICRGNLRVDSDEAYERIRDNVETTFGDRFLVALQEGYGGKPFFALVPNPGAESSAHQEVERERPGLALGLLAATLLTTMTAGAEISSLDRLFQSPTDLLQGIPYALALTAILGTHELGHFFAARYHQLKISLPYFIPVPFVLGTFGAFVQLRGPIPNRKSLFDVSVAGPLAGLAIALPLLLWGLAHSGTAPYPIPDEDGRITLSLNRFDPTLSVMLAILAKMAMGSTLAPGTLIQFHPLAYAGWLGLLVIALNLMPIGQLGGGHIVHAVYGQQMGANIGKIARVVVLLLAFTLQGWLIVWALLLLLLSSADEPALDDVTDLGEGRDLLGLFVLTVLTFIVLPVPPFMQAILGLA